MPSALVNGWARLDLSKRPYLYPGDEKVLKPGEHYDFDSADDYFKSAAFGKKGDRTFHLGLIPQPYLGSLESARVFLLMLNPGFQPGSYREYSDGLLKEALAKNLRQENVRAGYPLFWLDPQFASSPGFAWYYKKLSPLAEKGEKKAGSHLNAVKTLACKVAALELVPYHSVSFGGHKLLNGLPSTRAVLDYTRGELVQRAKRGDALIIVMRGQKYWDLPDHKNIVKFDGGAARGAHLTNYHDRILSMVGLQ